MAEKRYVNISKGLDLPTLEDWYLNSIANDTPPIWREEHLEELLKDFILISKDQATVDVNQIVVEATNLTVQEIEELKNKIPKKSSWEVDEYGNYYCKSCEEQVLEEEICASFCPHCGADMREGADDECD